MAPNLSKQPLKRPLEPRRGRGSVVDSQPREVARTCPAEEQRSKQRHDPWRVESRKKDKGKAICRSPPPKKQRRRQLQDDVEVEEEEEYEASTEDSEDESNPKSFSRSEDTEEEEDDTIVLEKEPSPVPRSQKHVIKKEKGILHKQLVRVDKRGNPYGKEAGYLANDIKSFAKDLNPAYGWSDQPMDEKKRFFERVYADWDVGGDASEINPAWFAQFVTKTLINVRHHLMKLIDSDSARPAGVNPEVWTALQDKRATAKAQEKSEQMRAISRARSTKEAQLRAIERNMMGELTLRLGRIPFEAELQEATDAEYARRHAELLRAKANYATRSDMENVRATTSEIGGRLTAMEGMIRQLVQSIERGNAQQQVLVPAPVGRPLLQADVNNNIPEDGVRQEDVAANVEEDAQMPIVQAADVAADVVPDPAAEVDYLVDPVDDDAVVNNTDNPSVEDIEFVNADAVNVIPTPAAEVALEDTNVPTGEETDPYSMVIKSASTEQGRGTVTMGQSALPQEVSNLPTAASSSRSNRVTRNVPLPPKATKFVAPTKSTKSAVPKLTKPSPSKAPDQSKKGEGPRKK